MLAEGPAPSVATPVGSPDEAALWPGNAGYTHAASTGLPSRQPPADAGTDDSSDGLLSKATTAALSAATLTTRAAASALGAATTAASAMLGGAPAEGAEDGDSRVAPSQSHERQGAAEEGAEGAASGVLGRMAQAVTGAAASAAQAVQPTVEQAAAAAGEWEEAEEQEGGGASLITRTAAAVADTAAAVVGAAAGVGGSEPAVGDSPAPGPDSSGAVVGEQPQRGVLRRPPLPTVEVPPGAAAPDVRIPAVGGPPAAAASGFFPVAGTAAPVRAPAPRPSAEHEVAALRPGPVSAEALKAAEAAAAAAAGYARPAPVTVQRSRPAEAVQRAATGPGTPSASATAGIHRTTQDEDWISELVEQLWPNIRAAVEAQCYELLPGELGGILQASKPSWLHDLELKKCSLGTKEPDLVFRDDNEVMEDVMLEFQFDWRSAQDVELEIQTLPENWDVAWLPSFIEKPLVDLLTFTVGVEETALRGSVRITMRPLLDRLPVVGALHISLIEQPQLDFDLTLGNSSSVPLEITPEHYFYQIDTAAEDVEKPVGALVVQVVEAVRVPKMDLMSYSQPFVEMFVRHTQRRQTRVLPSTKHPRWGETFELPVHVPEHQELTLVLWDYDWMSANDQIGRAKLPLSQLTPGQTADLWLDVESKSDEEWQASKQDMHKRQRVVGAAAKPFTRRKAQGCQVHVQASDCWAWAGGVHAMQGTGAGSPLAEQRRAGERASLRPNSRIFCVLSTILHQATFLMFSQAEQGLVLEGVRRGMEAALDSPQGRALDPRLRSLLLSGTLRAKASGDRLVLLRAVERAEGLNVHGLLTRPSVKFVVKAGGQEQASPAVKASRRGAVEFDQPVEVQLGAEHTQSQQAMVAVELHEAGMLRSGVRGRLVLRMAELVARRRVTGWQELEGGSRGARARVVIEYKPYF
eukprot:scaffold17.g505.t1